MVVRREFNEKQNIYTSSYFIYQYKLLIAPKLSFFRVYYGLLYTIQQSWNINITPDTYTRCAAKPTQKWNKTNRENRFGAEDKNRIERIASVFMWLLLCYFVCFFFVI